MDGEDKSTLPIWESAYETQVITNQSGLYFLESHSDYVDADDVTKRYRKWWRFDSFFGGNTKRIIGVR